jgi:hypothetical protein
MPSVFWRNRAAQLLLCVGVFDIHILPFAISVVRKEPKETALLSDSPRELLE